MAAAMEMSKLALAAEKVFGQYEGAQGNQPAIAGAKATSVEQTATVQDPQGLHLAAGSRSGGIVCVEV